MKTEYLPLRNIMNVTLKSVLEQIDHEIIDAFSNVLSSKNPDKVTGEKALNIEIEGKTALSFKVAEAHRVFLKNLLTYEYENLAASLPRDHQLQEAEILNREWREVISAFSQNGDINLALKKALNFFVTHSYFSSVAVYLILHGKIFLSVEHHLHLKEKKSSFSEKDEVVASYIANSGKSLVLASKEKQPLDSDPIAKSLSFIFGEKEIPNMTLAGIPLAHTENSQVFGVLLCKNHIREQISNRDLEVLHFFKPRLTSLFSGYSLKTEIAGLQNASATMEKYLDKNVVHIIRKTGTGDFVSTSRYVVVMFIIIADFGQIMDVVPPKDLVGLLNHFYTVVDNVVHECQGTIDKIIGNTIMVLWNHLSDQVNPETWALQTGLQLQKAMFYEQLVWKKLGVEDFGIKVGINGGKATVGNLGDKEFMNLTAIGDTINTGQRVAYAADKGTVNLNGHLLSKIQGNIKPVLCNNNLKVKGKAAPLTVYVYKPDSDRKAGGAS